jgi:hypothetical protein
VILQPAILALTVSSLLVSAMVLYSAFWGGVILRKWDISSGSELQLDLERRTYLVSTILAYFLALQVASLFLFIYTADDIATLFVGAMCAVGSLSVNGWGYPTLLLKLVNFLGAGIWLILNHADGQGYDYPLIRHKYLLLVIIAPFILAETIAQCAYFSLMRPDIITSCCGSLFSPASRSLLTDLATAPAMPTMAIFYLFMSCTLGAGLYFMRKGRGGYLFALLSSISFIVSLVAVVSFISLYIYQMPSHHCPFCILEQDYYFIGYPLYGSLLIGGVAGGGVGALMPFRGLASLAEVIPRIQRSLAVTALWGFGIFTLLATWPILFSSFRLG